MSVPDQGGYYPPMPPDNSRPALARGPMPPPVGLAQKLMFARAALGLVSLIVVVALRNTLRNDLRRNNPDWSGSKLDTAVNAAIAIGVVVGAVFLVLYVLLALKVGQGRNWARIVTVVLGALGIINALSGLAQDATGASKTIGLVSGVLDLAIVILLFQGRSSSYFDRKG